MKTDKETSLNREKVFSLNQEIELINPDKENLTPQILKTFPGYEDISEAEASETVELVKAFAKILLESVLQNKHTCIDNQQFVDSRYKTREQCQKQAA